MNKEIICTECESTFKVESDSNVPVEFCPFCSEKITFDDEDLDEWFEEDEINSRGC